MDPDQKTEHRSTNPLQKYFRQPSIYIKLPSDGEYWKEGSLNLPLNGEIPVYPLTTRDEVELRTPDALMNGASVANVIQSCCPNIVDVWSMPSIDVDAVLIAIRIASYGHDMDFDVRCPHCNAENTFTKDLRESLAELKKPNYKKTVNTNELIIKLKPAAYFQANKSGQINFEEAKLMQALENVDLDPTLRDVTITESTRRLIEIGLDNLTAVTDYIATHDGDVVTDEKYIRDFYANASSATVKLVNDQLAEFAKDIGTKPMSGNCTSCEKQFEVPIEFNYSSFFGKGF